MRVVCAGALREIGIPVGVFGIVNESDVAHRREAVATGAGYAFDYSVYVQKRVREAAVRIKVSVTRCAFVDRLAPAVGTACGVRGWRAVALAAITREARRTAHVVHIVPYGRCICPRSRVFGHFRAVTVDVRALTRAEIIRRSQAARIRNE